MAICLSDHGTVDGSKYSCDRLKFFNKAMGHTEAFAVFEIASFFVPVVV